MGCITISLFSFQKIEFTFSKILYGWDFLSIKHTLVYTNIYTFVFKANRCGIHVLPCTESVLKQLKESQQKQELRKSIIHEGILKSLISLRHSPNDFLNMNIS